MNEILAQTNSSRQLPEEIIVAGRERQATGRSPPNRGCNEDIMKGANLYYVTLQ
jgi:hypothetical protein